MTEQMAMMLMAVQDDTDEVVRAYWREAESLRYADLRVRQQRPWPSLAFGAAGVAYALWRAADGDRRRLAHAERILCEASEAPLDDYWDPAFGEPPDFRFSLYYGELGIVYLRTLVAHARGEQATYDTQLTHLLDRCWPQPDCQDEVLSGSAGLLNAARILYQHTRDARVEEAGERIAAHLFVRADAAPDGWLHRRKGGFGHGAVGIAHALLAWSQALARTPSSELRVALARLSEWPESGAVFSDPLRSSWCNGASGDVLLWTAAYEATGERPYFEIARARADVAAACAQPVGRDMCCGAAGRAYAFLAMDRIDPDGGWLARARAVAPRAALAQRRGMGKWPNGLYRGFPGVACLLRDLGRAPAERGGFPMIEG